MGKSLLLDVLTHEELWNQVYHKFDSKTTYKPSRDIFEQEQIVIQHKTSHINKKNKKKIYQTLDKAISLQNQHAKFQIYYILCLSQPSSRESWLSEEWQPQLQVELLVTCHYLRRIIYRWGLCWLRRWLGKRRSLPWYVVSLNAWYKPKQNQSQKLDHQIHGRILRERETHRRDQDGCRGKRWGINVKQTYLYASYQNPKLTWLPRMK